MGFPRKLQIAYAVSNIFQLGNNYYCIMVIATVCIFITDANS